MKWLLYGGRGWIGMQIKTLLRNMNEFVLEGQSRVDDYKSTYEEILAYMPDRVLCTIGRTSGKDCGNIDYLEQPGKLVENLRDNLHGPINLASICQKLNIHMTYLGTGCIYEFNEEHPMENYLGHGYTEEDIPNFTGSQYSVVKGTTDGLIRNFSTTLNARIRMPISAEKHPRNFVTKITSYDKVISIPNSMTVLPELLPILIDLAKNKVTGTINLTNPGCITHAEILDLYKKYIDPKFTYKIMDLSELSEHTIGHRSNNYLETTKLQSLYPTIKPIKESIELIFSKESLKND